MVSQQPRIHSRLAVILAAVIGAVLAAMPAFGDGLKVREGRSDPVLARDSGIDRLYALGGRVLYRRTLETGGSQWMRVLDGRRLRVSGLPAGAEPSRLDAIVQAALS